MFGPLMIAALGVRYNLDGENIAHVDSTSATAGVRINTDGTVDKLEGVTFTQIDAATDWIIPNDQATDQHWVRATQVSQTGGGTTDGTLDTWIQISGDPGELWRIDNTGSGTAEWEITLEIATDSAGNNVVASGNYTLSATIF